MKDLMTKKEVAEYYHVSVCTVDNWVKRGLVKTKIGKLARYKKEDLEKFVESQGVKNDN